MQLLMAVRVLMTVRVTVWMVRRAKLMPVQLL
jgi:hypothetical protein